MKSGCGKLFLKVMLLGNGGHLAGPETDEFGAIAPRQKKIDCTKQ